MPSTPFASPSGLNATMTAPDSSFARHHGHGHGHASSQKLPSGTRQLAHRLADRDAKGVLKSCVQAVYTVQKPTYKSRQLYSGLYTSFVPPVCNTPTYARPMPMVMQQLCAALNSQLTAWQQWLYTVSTSPITTIRY